MKMKCIAKIGEPYQMHECGKECEFLTPAKAAPLGLYSGWYHTDRDTTDHHAVPRSWVS